MILEYIKDCARKNIPIENHLKEIPTYASLQICTGRLHSMLPPGGPLPSFVDQGAFTLDDADHLHDKF
jgi:hypothetical protein